MKVSLNWLKRYVDIDIPVEEFCDRMTMSGFEVEDVEDLSASMENVKVGRIVKLEKHPDADKLQVCQLDVGEAEPVQIITGAQNLFEGALVPARCTIPSCPTAPTSKKASSGACPPTGCSAPARSSV